MTTLLIAACGKTIPPLEEKNTNWLQECAADADCGSGLACICGLCTRSCESPRDCATAATPATCHGVSDRPSQAECGGTLPSSTEAICVAVCLRDVDCPASGACRGGLCMAPTSAPVQDAGGVPREDSGAVRREDGGGTLDSGSPVEPDSGPSPVIVECGNGEREGAEACDGSAVNASCVDCELECSPGFGDCNGDAEDGCEADLQASADHCSGCGAACGAGESCFVGTCVRVLAADQSAPTELQLADDHLYWTNLGSFDASDNYQNDGSLVALPAAGGELVTLAGALDMPTHLAVDDTHAYLSLARRFVGEAVVRVPLTGGTPETLSDELGTVGGLAVDATHVYWFTYDTRGFIAMRVPKDGSGPAETLMTRQSVMSDSIAVDADRLYWFEDEDSFVAGKDGTNPTRLRAFSRREKAERVLMDDTYMYWPWGDASEVGVHRIDRTTGDLTVLANWQHGYASSGLAMDADALFWSYISNDDDEHRLVRTDRTPGDSSVVLQGPKLNAPLIAIDADWLYVMNRGRESNAGTLMRLAKP